MFMLVEFMVVINAAEAFPLFKVSQLTNGRLVDSFQMNGAMFSLECANVAADVFGQHSASNNISDTPRNSRMAATGGW
jgi:hypothetical protein